MTVAEYDSQKKKKNDVLDILTYSTFMGLLSSMTAHVYNQHILSLKGLLFSSAAIPVTSEVLAIFFDVITVDMLDKIIL